MARPVAETMGDGHHPLFPPSASSRWMECTASPLPISRGYEGEASRASAEGSLAHAIFADMLVHGGKPSSTLGQTYSQDGFDFPFDQAMLRPLEDAAAEVYKHGTGVLLVEQRVHLPVAFHDQHQKKTVTETIAGTADVLLVADAAPGTLHVMDLKFGTGVRVFAEWNSQMLIYAAGSIETHALLFDDIDIVVLHVLQPRLEHFDSWALTVDELKRWVNGHVQPAVAEVLTGAGEFRPGQETCRWCPLAGQCEAQAAFAMAPFADLDADPKQAPTEAGLLTPEHLAEHLEHFAVAEAFIRAARSRALRLCLDGDEVPGWKAVEGRSTRVWSDDDAMRAGCVLSKVEPFAEPALKSVAVVEKELGKKVFQVSDLAGLVRKPPGKPTLAPASDPRPSAWPTSTDDFEVETG